MQSPSTDQNLLAIMVLQPCKNQKKSVKDTTTVDIFINTNHNTTLDTNAEKPTTKPILSKFAANYFDTTKLQQEQDRDPGMQNIIHELTQEPNNLSFIFKDHLLCKLIISSPHSPNKT